MSEPPRSVGAAAAAAGVKVQTLHYYERRGLIRKPARSVSGYRLYRPEAIQTVRAIKRAQHLGFTLKEIEALMRIGKGRRSVEKVAAAARAKVEEIQEKIDALTSVRDRLSDLMERCHCGGDPSRCDVLAGLAEAPEGGRAQTQRR